MGQPRYSKGDLVSLKAAGRRGSIVRVARVGDEWQYEIFFGGDAPETYAERHLVSDEFDDSVPGRLKRWEFLDADEFQQALTTLKLRRPLQHNLYSYLASRTDLQPYQFKPVLKLLNSPYGRMFIADEVGLGKTIEAGIIMTELSARQSMRRILVCCPPALSRKWQAEMRERFDQDFEILKRDRLLELASDSDFTAVPFRGIASLSLLRRADLVEAIAETEGRFDLVVIDESHHMQNPETMSHRLGETLEAVSDHMLMLSATPLSLSTDNLFHQLSILSPDEFFDVADFEDAIAPNQFLNHAIRALRKTLPDVRAARDELAKIRKLAHRDRFVGNPLYDDICSQLAELDGRVGDELRLELQERINDLNTIGHVFTRTRKRDVQDHFPARRAHVIRVELSGPEKDFYDAVTDYVRRLSGDYANFATIMPQRQVASSIPAAREYLRERWGLSPVIVEDDTAAELELDAVEDEPLPELGTDERLRQAWEAADGADSKFLAFWKTVRTLVEDGTAHDGKILVFSFFRKTIEDLARRLRTRELGGGPVRASILYGPTPEEDRHQIVETFREEPGPHIVLASEIAAEGLDFEFVNAMVNYDLPWNPMRIEQRIGRLDRYGQQAKVIHIVNFSVRDTIEERILERLYERIGIFKAAIGDLESILGDEIEKLTRELLRPDRTPEEEAEVINQTADNILRRRLENEQFEEDSKALLGQDDIFTEQLNRLDREGRYIGPEEIRNFVEVGLRQHFPAVKVTDETDGTAIIHLPSDGEGVRQLMVNYLNQSDGRHNRRAWRGVDRAKGGSDWRVTFKPDVATRHRELDFVTLQHPLVGALLTQEADVRRPTVALRADGDVEETFVFFIYLLRVHSFRAGLEFLPVAVELDGEVDAARSARLLTLLDDVRTWDAGEDYPDEDAIDEALRRAEEWASRQVKEREAELLRVSDQIIDRRIASLEESLERWLIKRRELLTEAEQRGDTTIARLHRGYIRRRKTEVAAKVGELGEQRGVDVGRELIAGGLLRIGTHSDALVA